MTIAYANEIPILLSEALFYVGTIITALFVRRGMWQQQTEKPQAGKLCAGRGSCAEGSLFFVCGMRSMAMAGLVGSFILPAVLIPRTAHPLMGWSVELLGAVCFLFVMMTMGNFPGLPVLTPWLGIVGALIVMAVPIYSNGIVRALAIGVYSFVASPFLWWAFKEILSTIGCREAQFRGWTNFRPEPPSSQLTKMY